MQQVRLYIWYICCCKEYRSTGKYIYICYVQIYGKGRLFTTSLLLSMVLSTMYMTVNDVRIWLDLDWKGRPYVYHTLSIMKYSEKIKGSSLWGITDFAIITVIMSAMASQITGVSIVCSTDIRKHQISPSLAFVLGIHRWQWIPRTKGQYRGKCFHLMTSSWR